MHVVMKEDIREIEEANMDESVQKLRFDFEAETDCVLDSTPENWKQYALWLERLNAGKVNNEVVRENDVLRNMMQEAMDLLGEGIVSRIE